MGFEDGRVAGQTSKARPRLAFQALQLDQEPDVGVDPVAAEFDEVKGALEGHGAVLDQVGDRDRRRARNTLLSLPCSSALGRSCLRQDTVPKRPL